MDKLDEVIKLIENGWCQGVSARDKNGVEVDCVDKKAVSFCVIGAIHKVCDFFYEEVIIAKSLLPKVGGNVAKWNDEPGQTKENVIKVLKEISSSKLDEVIKLIEEGWTQYTDARDKDGLPVEYHNKDAVCFSLRGAISKASTNVYQEVSLKHLIARKVGYSIFDWNDEPEQTKENIIKVLKEINSGNS